ncbi:heme utilization protein [Acinetobacter venetianus]|uniref:DUF6160 domain-containing protein n=1 Tax=Acinetobacter venetianus (strain ATCC 31012 / DSM 23050 / BCRC 14357 / CCUG 45561 / CIP 110063 / KCTC 2702 / LMG 19082 / RAG-1) TaxID=1191460 RepID=N8YHY7_ACIVR|nr:DUF6160 family protein [Acinetobacter venetianus]ENV36316.1 hypothetical protein F959_02846 [Acinetobacter venetianus RAG-1 = CIP 110063]QNH50625.1 heme utilization protein [Acinetobacter venetianus]
MKIKNQNQRKKWFALSTLATSLFFVNQTSFALQSLDDSALRSVNGQDGISISTTYDAIDVQQFYWEDDAGRGSVGATNTKLRAIAEGFKVRQSNASTLPLGTNYQINIGSNAGKSGVDFNISSDPSLITIDNFKICDTETIARCSDPVGTLALQTSSPLGITFKTRDGLFSKTSQSSLVLGLKNINLYLGQVDASNQLNQLILKNLNFNFLGKGVMYVDDKEGLRIQTNAVGTANALTTDKPSGTLGYVDFTRVEDSGSAALTAHTYSDSSGKATNAGLNLEFMTNKNVVNADSNTRYAIDSNTKSPVGANGLIRLGASGRMVNGSLQVRGITSGTLNDPVIGTGQYGSPNGTNIIGKANNGASATPILGGNVIGNSGIAFRMKADFTTESDMMLDTNMDGTLSADEKKNATRLEIGGAGLNTYGFEFGNLTGLQAGSRGTFDSGNIYINLADTKSILIPANYVFQTSRFGNGQFLTGAADYTQNIHTGTGNTNPYSIILAVRGAEFQAISKQGRFTNSATYNPAAGYQPIIEHDGSNNTTNKLNTWGLALPFYNLNANMAMYGTSVDASTVYAFDKNGVKTAIGSGNTPRLGFSLAMSTSGIDRDASFVPQGNKTTSILVVDGGDNDNNSVNGVQPTNYYIGLRNIDMLLKGAGTIGVEKGSFNASLKDMLIVMAAELAAGYLPGSTYKTCAQLASATGCATRSVAPANSFALNDDVLLGLKLRIGGDMDLSLIPNNEYKSDGTGNSLIIAGDLTLKGTGNTIQISDPTDGSTLGLDNLSGKMAFNNSIVIGRHSSGEGMVGFNTGLTFNPAGTNGTGTNAEKIAGVFRARDINLYPPSTGAGARLGEMVLTGGQLNSQLGIIPRN